MLFLAGARVDIGMGALIAIAGVVILVWGAVVFARGGLLGGCLAVLVVGIVAGQPFFKIPLGPLPLTADRVLWAILLVAYVVWRRWGLTDPKPLTAPDVLMVLFLVWLTISTFAHDWRAHGAWPVSRLVFFYMMPLGLYWVARQSAIDQRGATWLVATLALLGVYLAVTAIAETHQAWWLVYPRYIASQEQPDFFGRARGPLLNPVGNGILLGVGLGSVLLGCLRVGRLGRLLLCALAVLIAVGIYSTLTRTAWIGAALGTAILLGLVLSRAWRILVLGGGLAAASLLAATQWENLLAFKRDEGATAADTAESVKLRPILARVAWNMFLDRPLAGCGFGQYMDQSIYYLDDRSTELVLEKARPYCQHNLFFSLLTETGLIGAGLFVALLALWGRDAWRLWRSDGVPAWARQHALLMLVLMGNYLPNAMFHDVSLIPMVNMLLFLLAGVTEGLRPLAVQSPERCLPPAVPSAAGQSPARLPASAL